MRHRLEVQGLLEEQEAPGIPETLAGAVARLRGGGLLAELIDPPQLNEPDPTLIMGPERQRNFERFFQDSVVRDEDGEPVIVYHGTKRDFDRFDDRQQGSSSNNPNTGLGHYFSSLPDVANQFAGASLYKTMMGSADQDGRILPMNLRLNNPYIVRSEGGYGLSLGDRQMKHTRRKLDPDVGGYRDAYRVLYQDLADDYGIDLGHPVASIDEAEDLKQLLMDDGYDGIIIKDTIMDAEIKPQDHYIIFDPKQAKSIFNDGSYDLDDDNFMSQLGRMRGLLEG